MRTRTIFRIGVMFFLFLFLVNIVFWGISFVVYDRLSSVQPKCMAHDNEGTYTPARFYRQGFDTAPYWMPYFEEVSIPSRTPSISISGYYIPADGSELISERPAKTIIIVHGRNDCRRRPQSLTPAGMLHRHGFNVLAIDLRNHGDSTSRVYRQLEGQERRIRIERLSYPQIGQDDDSL